MYLFQSEFSSFPDICLRMGFWGHMVTVFSFLINFHTVSHRRRQWQPTPVLLPGKSYGQRTPWMGSLGVRHNWATSTFAFHFHALEKEMATHSSVPAWRIPGTGEPGRLPSLGLHRFGHDWSDLAAAAAPIYIPTNRVWEFPLLHILINIICVLAIYMSSLENMSI